MCDRYPYTIKAARFLPPPLGLSSQVKGFPKYNTKQGGHAKSDYFYIKIYFPVLRR
jgi:hypothetical protein